MIFQFLGVFFCFLFFLGQVYLLYVREEEVFKFILSER